MRTSRKSSPSRTAIQPRNIIDPFALQESVKYLAGRDRFEAELRAHLTSKQMIEEADAVIEHLRRRRIIDDGKLIQNLVERNAGKRAVGKEKLRAELLRRGAPEVEVDMALAETSEPEETLDRLLAEKLRPGDSRAKAGRFLVSRGFEEEQIESALDRHFGTD